MNESIAGNQLISRLIMRIVMCNICFSIIHLIDEIISPPTKLSNTLLNASRLKHRNQYSWIDPAWLSHFSSIFCFSDLTYFNALLNQTGLRRQFDDTAAVTVLAPSNEALLRLEAQIRSQSANTTAQRYTNFAGIDRKLNFSGVIPDPGRVPLSNLDRTQLEAILKAHLIAVF